MPAAATLALALALALAFPAGAGATALIPDWLEFPEAPQPQRAQIARLTAATVARAQPGGGELLYRFGTRARWNGGPVGLSVTDTARRRGRRYLRVLLPARPNGVQGWIPAGRARVSETRWRIVIDLSARRLTLSRDGEPVRRWGVVIGAPGTPTPVGRFAINENVRQPDPGGFLGTWILHLTAFSDVLDNFGGGPGRVGIHGRSGESLNDPLGSAASHGCVRMDNAAVSYLARRAREGTPVKIRA